MTKKMLKDLSASSIPLARFQRGSHTAEAERPNITMHTALFIGLAMPYHAHSTPYRTSNALPCTQHPLLDQQCLTRYTALRIGLAMPHQAHSTLYRTSNALPGTQGVQLAWRNERLNFFVVASIINITSCFPIALFDLFCTICSLFGFLHYGGIVPAVLTVIYHCTPDATTRPKKQQQTTKIKRVLLLKIYYN